MAIVRTILALAQSLDLDVVAGGWRRRAAGLLAAAWLRKQFQGICSDGRYRPMFDHEHRLDKSSHFQPIF